MFPWLKMMIDPFCSFFSYFQYWPANHDSNFTHYCAVQCVVMHLCCCARLLCVCSGKHVCVSPAAECHWGVQRAGRRQRTRCSPSSPAHGTGDVLARWKQPDEGSWSKRGINEWVQLCGHIGVEKDRVIESLARVIHSFWVINPFGCLTAEECMGQSWSREGKKRSTSLFDMVLFPLSGILQIYIIIFPPNE